MGNHKGQMAVYAVLRYDGFLGSEVLPEHAITVKEVVWSLELAESEVARLNALQEDKGVRYWWQCTRLYPEGSAAGHANEFTPTQDGDTTTKPNG
jgi:hypothetical protein